MSMWTSYMTIAYEGYIQAGTLGPHPRPHALLRPVDGCSFYLRSSGKKIHSPSEHSKEADVLLLSQPPRFSYCIIFAYFLYLSIFACFSPILQNGWFSSTKKVFLGIMYSPWGLCLLIKCTSLLIKSYTVLIGRYNSRPK